MLFHGVKESILNNDTHKHTFTSVVILSPVSGGLTFDDHLAFTSVKLMTSVTGVRRIVSKCCLFEFYFRIRKSSWLATVNNYRTCINL